MDDLLFHADQSNLDTKIKRTGIFRMPSDRQPDDLVLACLFKHLSKLKQGYWTEGFFWKPKYTAFHMSQRRVFPLDLFLGRSTGTIKSSNPSRVDNIILVGVDHGYHFSLPIWTVADTPGNEDRRGLENPR